MVMILANKMKRKYHKPNLILLSKSLLKQVLEITTYHNNYLIVGSDSERVTAIVSYSVIAEAAVTKSENLSWLTSYQNDVAAADDEMVNQTAGNCVTFENR